jgi:hypothetical protein
MLGRKQQRASRAEKAVLSDARADFKSARCLASERQDWQAALPVSADTLPIDALLCASRTVARLIIRCVFCFIYIAD